MDTIYNTGRITEKLLRLSYNWKTYSQVQFGFDLQSMHHTYNGDLVSFSALGTNTIEQGWNLNITALTYGDQYMNITPAKAQLLSNYAYISVPPDVYNMLLAMLPDSFVLTNPGNYWATNNATDCMNAQNSFEDLTFVMNGYNFTIPASAYIVNFQEGYSFTHFYNANQCVFMLESTIILDQNYFGLGDAFLW